jgi:AcrR family transcriptional regulator
MAKATERASAGEADAGAVDEESRASRFMRSALSILGETGRTDFTVLEVVERSKTSLRSFYQHFATKDELLLALVGRIMTESTLRWRDEIGGLSASDALHVLLDRITAPAESSTQNSINRGLTFYNDHLAETMPREYADVLAPVLELIKDIIGRGMAEGAFADDLEVDPTATLIMQSALGAMRLRVLGAELNGVPLEGRHIFEFCMRALKA